jgi:hypothetical protein
MNHHIESINTPINVATRFVNSGSVPSEKSFHQSAAIHAAQMIGCQYARKSKSEFRRKCLDHLKASLVGGVRA